MRYRCVAIHLLRLLHVDLDIFCNILITLLIHPPPAPSLIYGQSQDHRLKAASLELHCRRKFEGADKQTPGCPVELRSV